MLTEDEKKAIENKDKIRLNKIILDYINQNNEYASEIYELTSTLNYLMQESDIVITKVNIKIFWNSIFIFNIVKISII